MTNSTRRAAYKFAGKDRIHITTTHRQGFAMNRLILSITVAAVLVSCALPMQAMEPALKEKLAAVLDSMQRTMKVKSLSAAVRSGNTTWAGARGLSGAFDSVTTNSIYLIGSTVKTITSSCILQLADEQKLSLDDSIGRYLDPIEFIDPKITIRQLLRHQSGLFDILSNTSFQPTMLANRSTVFDAEDLVVAFIQKPQFAPGAGWAYCNTNYFLLGMIIKKITGNPFYTEFRNRYFDPLGLGSFVIPAFEKRPAQPVAHVWFDLNGDGTQEDAHDFYYNWLSLNSAAGAAGGYYATASNVAEWMQKSMRGDLYSAAMQQQARTTVPSSGLPGSTYGLGLMKRDFLGITGYGHPGDLSYSSSAWYFPRIDVSISVLMNDSRQSLNSWSLVPVVTALLKAYNDVVPLSVDGEEQPAAMPSVSLNAYPNPADGDLTVTLDLPRNPARVEIVLSDIIGSEILRTSTTGANQGINVFTLPLGGGIPRGLYVVTAVVDGLPVQSIRIIKES
ncbi:MAG: serine hydrolase [Candidatus Kapabacteria bacterium]|nr:serine hydrolase [Candidatus Kapabacteria bacterium]